MAAAHETRSHTIGIGVSTGVKPIRGGRLPTDRLARQRSVAALNLSTRITRNEMRTHFLPALRDAAAAISATIM
jgi:hypothetical protein